jgi:hypothetical protein
MFMKIKALILKKHFKFDNKAEICSSQPPVTCNLHLGAPCAQHSDEERAIGDKTQMSTPTSTSNLFPESCIP